MSGEIKAGICFFVHDGKGKFLIGKRAKHLKNEPGLWSPGAGTVEYGEDPEVTLVREMEEEYGAKPLSYTATGTRNWVNEINRIHWFVFDFVVLGDPAHIKNNEPDKCDEVRWVTLEELDAMLDAGEPFHPTMRAYMDKYRALFESL